jgi:hypothetical protein
MINEDRQVPTHSAKPWVSDSSLDKAEIAIERLKRYKLTGIDQSGRTDPSR